jgi:CBS domain containing-hemolysin-like protein
VNITMEILAALLCVLVEAAFSGSEIAIVASDRLVLRRRAEAGDTGAARVLRMLEQPARLVGTCLIGTNLAIITGATLSAHVISLIAGGGSELWVILTYTPLTIIFGEMLPKSVFHQHATQVAPIVARPLAALQVVLWPALWSAEKVTQAAMGLAGASGTPAHAVRREDIMLMLDANATSSPDLQQEEREMAQRVLNFCEKSVQEAMVPLIEVTGVSESATVEEAAALLVDQGFSRMPVYRKRVDRIVGLVHQMDVLFAADRAVPVSAIMREIMIVPESKRVDQLFVDMRRKRQGLAVAVDEYGGAVGIITLEDILEEIVGDIGDEFDSRRPMVRRSGEREWVASGRTEAETLHDVAGFELPEGDWETLAGFVLAQLGHVPAVGERLTTSTGWTLAVARANERAILEVTLVAPVLAAPRSA